MTPDLAARIADGRRTCLAEATNQPPALPALSDWVVRELIAHLEADLRAANKRQGAHPDEYWKQQERIKELERHLAELRRL